MEFDYEYDIGAAVPYTFDEVAEEVPIKGEIFVQPGETQTIDVTLYFMETNEEQNYNQGKKGTHQLDRVGKIAE